MERGARFASVVSVANVKNMPIDAGAAAGARGVWRRCRVYAWSRMPERAAAGCQQDLDA